jgi:uncharacterized protein
MYTKNGKLVLSASDLSGYIGCRHLSNLDLQVVNGSIAPPNYHDPLLEILQKRGLEFEKEYLKYLRGQNLIISLPNDNDKEAGIQRTLDAMESGVDIIYQATLKLGQWQGRADFLQKVPSPSNLGEWSYEVIDCKLAKETRAGTILQLCLYSEMAGQIQGKSPEFMHVITPESGFSKINYRYDDFGAYYRFIKGQLVNLVEQSLNVIQTYPNPCAHCDICRWWKECDSKRREDDHLSLVAGLGNLQAKQIKNWDITTLEQLAAAQHPLPHRPRRGSINTYNKLREQARVQFESRDLVAPKYEILDINQKHGFCLLPEPDNGDIFFDFEGDPFVGTSGLEYLFGWVYKNETDNLNYKSIKALNLVQEKNAFEEFIDWVWERWKEFPNMHIFHFTAYEPSALKRLMGKHATRENEVDDMLRAGLFVDLHSIVKRSIRAGIESYSLKELELLHGFNRSLDLRIASKSLRVIESFIEQNNTVDIPDELFKNVIKYNEEDCQSTFKLRNWLESLRKQAIESGTAIERPIKIENNIAKNVNQHLEQIKPLFDALMVGIHPDPLQRSDNEQARWILANMLDWYRREKKAYWWEYYRLRELNPDELLDEKATLTYLKYTNIRTQIKNSVIDTYEFPDQEYEFNPGNEISLTEGGLFGTIESVDYNERVIKIKKGPSKKDIHPETIFLKSDIRDVEKENAIIRLSKWVCENGFNLDATGDLLLRKPPRTITGWNPLDNPQDNAVNWVQALEESVLPIQGPPGTGKSHTASRMILELINNGKTVGITAMSHKVIVGLMEKVIHLAEQSNMAITCIRKVSKKSESPNPKIQEIEDNKEMEIIIERTQKAVFGGTPFLWSREKLAECKVDYLFVDEAGQLSLIDTVAVSMAARNLILLGDPQQLKQPQQGSHPDGTEVSALEHILQDHKTIPDEKGIFLDTTWRLHPTLCAFVSELFYENRLKNKPELENQSLEGNTDFSGAGLWFHGIDHEGNQSSSIEEANAIKSIIDGLLDQEVYFVDSDSERRRLVQDYILLI